jgi:hypothetical protein
LLVFITVLQRPSWGRGADRSLAQNEGLGGLRSGEERHTPTLRRLAGELHPTLGDSGPLFEEILDELGVAVPDMSRAGLVLAKAYAMQIIEGSLSAYDGARQIWRIQMEVEGLTPELGPFVYWASEWEEASSPEERRECEAGIRAAAVEFAGVS